MEAEGLITRTRGKGTFAADDIPETRQSIPASLSDMVRSLSDSNTKPLEIKTIKVGESRIPRAISLFFTMKNKDQISRIRRLVTQNKVLYFHKNYMPVDIAKHLTQKEPAEKIHPENFKAENRIESHQG